MNLPSYNLDSLTFLSSEVIEGKFIQRKPFDHFDRMEVEVEAVHKGSLKPGQVITLTATDFYKKSNFERSISFDPGDYLVLFLSRAHATFLYNIPASETMFWTAPSGLKLVVGQQVLSFSQWMNPGPYVLDTPEPGDAGYPPPTLAEYRRSIGESVRNTDSMAALFAGPPAPADGACLLEILRQKALRLGYGRDELAERAAARLANLHDLPLLWQATPFVPVGGCHEIVGRGFGFPAGRESLLATVADPAAPMEKRLAGASLLGHVGVIYGSNLQGIDFHSPGQSVGDPGKDNAGFLTRIALLAAENRPQEGLCAALLRTLYLLKASSLGDVQQVLAVATDDTAAMAIVKTVSMENASAELRSAWSSLENKHRDRNDQQ